jgi:hypothetical protein
MRGRWLMRLLQPWSRGLPPSRRTIRINRHRLPAAMRKRRDKQRTIGAEQVAADRRRSAIANPGRRMYRPGSRIIMGLDRSRMWSSTGNCASAAIAELWSRSSAIAAPRS